MPVYSGFGRSIYPVAPRFSDPSTQEMTTAPRALITENSFYYRAILPREGGAIRDELSNLTLENMAPPPDDLDATESQYRSPAEIMSVKLEAERKKYLKQAWELLRENDYSGSDFAFENALVVKRDDLEAHVGRFLAAVGDNRVGTVKADLDVIVHHHDDMFAYQVSLVDALGDKELVESVLTNWAAAEAAMSDLAYARAVHAYLLWLDGQREAAQDIAGVLARDFRTTPYGSFADKMREQIRSEQETSLAATEPAVSP